MSAAVRKKYVSHKVSAAAAQAASGEWVYVTTYASRYTAESIVRFITHERVGQLKAYEPIGSYEAEIREDDEGAALWVKYVGAGAEVSTP